MRGVKNLNRFGVRLLLGILILEILPLFKALFPDGLQLGHNLFPFP